MLIHRCQRTGPKPPRAEPTGTVSTGAGKRNLHSEGVQRRQVPDLQIRHSPTRNLHSKRCDRLFLHRCLPERWPPRHNLQHQRLHWPIDADREPDQHLQHRLQGRSCLRVDSQRLQLQPIATGPIATRPIATKPISTRSVPTRPVPARPIRHLHPGAMPGRRVLPRLRELHIPDRRVPRPFRWRLCDCPVQLARSPSDGVHYLQHLHRSICSGPDAHPPVSPGHLRHVPRELLLLEPVPAIKQDGQDQAREAILTLSQHGSPSLLLPLPRNEERKVRRVCLFL